MTTSTQPLQALAIANQVRIEGADLRRELGAGKITLVEAIVDHRAARLTIERLLTGQRRWGPARARTMLSRLGIFGSIRVDQLTARQRDRLLERIASY